MSWTSDKYVRGLRTRPGGERAGKPLSPAERLVVRAISQLYRDELGCAYGSLRTIGEACGYNSDGYVRGVVAGLEEACVVRRTAMQRGADGSQTTNLYDFPLMGFAACRPMCIAAEWPMRKAAWERVLVVRAEFFRDGRRAMGRAAAVQMSLREAGVEPDSAAGAPPDSEAGSELYGDIYHDYPPPMPPSGAVDCGKAAGLADGGLQEAAVAPGAKSCLVMGEAKATASAKATATTVPLWDPAGAQNGVGRSGMSSPGRSAGAPAKSRPWDVRERVSRRGRSADDVRAGLDGEDAAWHDEVTRVMLAIDVTDESLRKHLLQAMQMYAAKQGCTIAAVGLLAVQRWREFMDPSVVRANYPTPKKFFREGLWLRPQAWVVDRVWQAQQRASVGLGSARLLAN